MKRIFAAVLCVLLCLTVCACTARRPEKLTTPTTAPTSHITRPTVFLGENQEFRDLFDVTGFAVATARVTVKDGNVTAVDLYNAYGDQYFLYMAGEGNALSITATAVTEYRLSDKKSVKSSLFYNQKFYGECVYTEGYLTTYIHYDYRTVEAYRFVCDADECLTVSPPNSDRVTVSVYSKGEGTFLRQIDLNLYDGTVITDQTA